MASGKTHATASLITSVPLGIVAGISLGSIFYGVGAVVGSVLGIALTPDLDQEMTTYFEWKLIRKTGPLGYLWMALWAPYALLVPHRSFWSHFPIVGTVLRLIYILVLPTIFYVYKGYNIIIPEMAWKVVLGLVIGLAISDALHWIMDGCPM